MLVTPQTLWKDFDRKKLPLDERITKTVLHPTMIERQFYFNGLSASDGTVRVFARLFLPNNFTNETPILLTFAGVYSNIMEVDTELSILSENGYGIMLVDYVGEREDRQRYTIYPESLQYARFTLEAASACTFPIDPTQSCWFVYSILALRAVTYLETSGFKHIGVIGAEAGGSLAFKLGFLAADAISAAVILYPSPLDTINCDNENDMNYLSFKASMDSESYIPLQRAPVLMLTNTNDPSGGQEKFLNYYSALTRNDCLLYITKRNNRSLSASQLQNIRIWFDYYLLKKDLRLPCSPVLRVFASEGQLYCNVSLGLKKPQQNQEPQQNHEPIPQEATKHISVVKAEIFYSVGDISNGYLNWRCIKPEQAGEHEFLKNIPVYAGSKDMNFFANITFSDGFTASTPLVTKNPTLLGVKECALIKKRLIYETDMGIGDWQSAGFSLPSVQDGPLNIAGLCNNGGMLSTFKLGDEVYSGERDYVLQIIVAVKAKEKLVFAVTEALTHKKYYCSKTFLDGNGDSWHKITFEASDFKSEDGVLMDWTTAVKLDIHSNYNFLISSMLWI